jgi:PAS domain S-box-containing protein
MHYLKKELYERIKTDDEIFDFLQESSLDGLWYWDLTNQEQEWMNPKFWRTLGYDPDEMPNLSSAWRDIINPDDLKLAVERVGQHIADPSVPYDQVVRYAHKNGQTVWIRCRGMAIRDENGKATRLLGTHVNVTAEKEKELLLERSQKIASIGRWEVDTLNDEIFWDKQVRQIHEVPEDYQPQLSQAINFYKEGRSRDMIIQLFNETVANGTPFDVELQLTTAKGRDIWIRTIGQAEMLNGECRRVYGIFQDIDTRKRNELRLLNYSILEAKAKEMEQFAYVASHDLREPLLTINGYLDVIREDFGKDIPAEVLGYLKTISSATDRMDVLIKGMLDYSRLSQVKKLQKVDLKKMLGEVIADLDNSIQREKAEVKYSELPEIYGYPLELKLLFQNLISNAIRYRQEGKAPHIKVGCAVLEHGWQFTVTDNGIGIQDSQLSNIFGLYRQLHDKGKSDGYGIGLANCKKIVELHGGTIWATSIHDEGSVFHFTLMTKEAGEA